MTAAVSWIITALAYIIRVHVAQWLCLILKSIQFSHHCYLRVLFSADSTQTRAAEQAANHFYCTTTQQQHHALSTTSSDGDAHSNNEQRAHTHTHALTTVLNVS